MSPAKNYKEATGVRARSDITANPRTEPIAHTEDALTRDQLIAGSAFLYGLVETAESKNEGTITIPTRTGRKFARCVLQAANTPGMLNGE